MERKGLIEKLIGLIKKYKYAILIFLLGMGLMMYPTKDKSKSVEMKQSIPQKQTVTLEDQLSEALSKVQGAGKVKVILSVSQGEETVYQTDQNTSDNKDAVSVKTDTVTVDKSGLVKQIIPPVYKGAIVLCQGADSPGVRLAIVDAVSKITGIGSDRISVLKMK